jgi:glycosyltransferase involved in cell wall biosynthesis
VTRVLFVQQQPCMRAMKYAVAVRAARPDIELGFAYQGKTLSEWYGSGDELFSWWSDLGDKPKRTLPAAIDAFRPDVIHSHNLPDALTVLANETVAARVPVVHDVHDLQSLRQTAYENGFPEPADVRMLERRAIEESAAVVAVSEELVAEIAARYRLPEHALVFANYALRRDLPRLLTPAEPENGSPPKLVYQGTLSTNGGHYDLREIFVELVESGATLDIHPSRDVPAYRELAEEVPGLRYHETLDPPALLQVLPRYDFGWAGFNASLNAPHIDTALPNKLFEYLGCGLPVLTLNHRALRRFLRERGLGIALGRPADLQPELARRDITKLRRRVASARYSLTTEANIGRLLALYDALTDVRSALAARAASTKTAPL